MAEAVRIEEEVPNLPVEHLGGGVYLVEDAGMEFGVDRESCGCGGTAADPCIHFEAVEAADIAVSRPSSGDLAYQYLLLDEASKRLVEARAALAAVALGELSDEVHELVEQVEEETENVWEDLWDGPLELAS